MKTQINNVVVKNQTPETGKRIIELFKQLGVDTMGYEGDNIGGNSNYGIIKNQFGCHSNVIVMNKNAQIFESVQDFENSEYFKSKTETKMSDLADFTPATIDNIQVGQVVWRKEIIVSTTKGGECPIKTNFSTYTQDGMWKVEDKEPCLFMHTPQPQKEFTPYWAKVWDINGQKKVKRFIISHYKKMYIGVTNHITLDLYAWRRAEPISPEIEALESEIETMQKEIEAKQNRLSTLKANEIEVNE